LNSTVSLYAHSITRATGGPKKVTVRPSATPVAWIPTFDDKKDESFGYATVGQWLESKEDPLTGKSNNGLVRPIFDVKAHPNVGGASGHILKPRGALHLFTAKKLDLKAGQMMSLN
jgi:hypothetical protein